MSEVCGLHERALQALETLREQRRVQDSANRAMERAQLVTELIVRLRETLEIDATGMTAVWVEGEYGQVPQLAIEGVRFSIHHGENRSVLLAEVERTGCGHAVATEIAPDVQLAQAWARLGELFERAAREGPSCHRCAAERRPPAPPPPSSAERLLQLLREVVREELDESERGGGR